MKKSCILFILVLVFTSCNRGVEKPENLIDREKMVAILYDYAILDAVRSQNIKGGILPNEINAYIFKKHKIDSLQFVKSNRYYASDPESYQKIVEQVKMKLEEEKLKTVPGSAPTDVRDTKNSETPTVL